MDTRPGLMLLEDALAALLASAQPVTDTDSVPTQEADGRVLATDLSAPLDVPGHDNSAMDGYAVRWAEMDAGLRAGRDVWPVSQRIPAGHFGPALAQGSVARIFTGAPLPAGADAVLMQEDTEVLDEVGGVPQVRVLRTPQLGAWVRRRGEDVVLGSAVLRAGQRLGPAELGLAASLGQAHLAVMRRVRVALLSTGDELVTPGVLAPEQLPPGAIYNSNRYFLFALLRRLGCEVSDLGVLPDDRAATVAALRAAAHSHDLILTSGGVSVGEEDHVKPAVQQLGALDLWQIGMKPGKPFAHGWVARALQADGTPGAGSVKFGSQRCHVIGLPGNPVSSFITFALLVRPFLRRLQGESVASTVLQGQLLPAHFALPRGDRRREFLRVRRNAQGGLDLFPTQSSGVLTSVAWADGLVDNPPGQAIAHGDAVRYLSFDQLLH